MGKQRISETDSSLRIKARILYKMSDPTFKKTIEYQLDKDGYLDRVYAEELITRWQGDRYTTIEGTPLWPTE